MEASQWRKAKRILEDALDAPPADRAAFVSRACGADQQLAAEVHALLAADTGDMAFLERSPALAGADAPGPVVEGRRLGPYRLIRELGRGGMGVVYLGERDDDAYRKRVAIKVLSTLDSEAVMRRFLQERQILANMDHPGIAKLLDGGADEEGRPYFVMEHVDGEQIRQYCETRQLSIRQRLTLFLKVCDAVQHAHRNLVVQGNRI